MSEELVNIQILIQRDVCSRVCAVNQLKLQAINLGLDKDYINLLDDWLLEAVRLDTQEELTTLYDDEYDNLIAARDTAFQQFTDNLKAVITIPPKTPVS